VNGHFNCFDLDVHSLAWFSYLSPIFAVQVRGATVYRAPSKQTLSVVQASCPSPSVISGVWTPLPWSGSSSSMGVPLPRPWRGWASCPRPAEKSTCLEETVRTPWPVIFAHWQIPVTFPDRDIHERTAPLSPHRHTGPRLLHASAVRHPDIRLRLRSILPKLY
jgi:hypothetical protein